MLTKKPISLAVGSACLLATTQAFGQGLLDLCGTTVDTDTYTNDCDDSGGQFDTLTADCKIKVDENVNLSLNDCSINADGYQFKITGEQYANLAMENMAISNASNINISFKGNEETDLDPNACYSNSVIDVNNSDFSAFGNKGDVKISTDCGNIRIGSNNVYSTSNNYITGERAVMITTDTGDINIDTHANYNDGHPAIVINSGTYEGGGVIKVHAGGELPEDYSHDGGNAQIRCAQLFAGSIQINSEGNAPFVGCFN